mgnify:CR=1 FL=1
MRNFDLAKGTSGGGDGDSKIRDLIEFAYRFENSLLLSLAVSVSFLLDTKLYSLRRRRGLFLKFQIMTVSV